MRLTDQEARKELSETQKMAKRVNHLLAGFVLVILCIPFFTMCTSARAADVGDVRSGLFPVCGEKDEAIAVAEAYTKGGYIEADKVLDGKATCAHVYLDILVGDVLYVASAGEDFIKVVRVTNPINPSQVAYWITTVNIEKNPAPTPKSHKPDGVTRPGRNL